MTELTVNAQATLMADWACYIDDVLHQDPEMAIQQGYPGVVMPEGALSVLAVEPELVDLDLLRAGRLRRTWTGPTRAVEDARLTVSVEKQAGSVTTTFTGEDSTVVAVERLEEADPPIPTRLGGPAGFRTGPIDLSRVRALLWSIDLLRDTPRWTWGNEPPAVADRAVGLLLPSLVAARSATGPARWRRRVTELTCQPTGVPVPIDGVLETVTTGDGEVRLFHGGALVAVASATVAASDLRTY